MEKLSPYSCTLSRLFILTVVSFCCLQLPPFHKKYNQNWFFFTCFFTLGWQKSDNTMPPEANSLSLIQSWPTQVEQWLVQLPGRKCPNAFASVLPRSNYTIVVRVVLDRRRSLSPYGQNQVDLLLLLKAAGWWPRFCGARIARRDKRRLGLGWPGRTTYAAGKATGQAILLGIRGGICVCCPWDAFRLSGGVGRWARWFGFGTNGSYSNACARVSSWPPCF